MIEILPESSNDLLVTKATGKLTTEDYEKVWIPALDEILKNNKKIRAVCWFSPEFKGWEAGAIWDDAKFGIKHRNDIAKMAILGGPEWVVWATKLSAHFLKGTIKTFESKDFQAAVELPQARNSSRIG